MRVQPLANIKVLDLTWHIAGPYCTKLLADYGADVLKVEQPGPGDPARAYGPFPHDDPHPERSGTFLHLNTNKRSITVDVKNEAGKLIIRDLVKWADVVVENFSPGVLQHSGLDYESLRKIKPDLVMCSITNFGQTGPYRDWKTTEFILAAMAGLTITTGVEDREPLKSADHLQEYQGGSMGTMALMGAIMRQRRDGVGEYIDVSIHEVASDSADRRATLLTGYAYTGVSAGREPTLAGALPLGVYPCADGYVSLVVSPAARWPRFLEMLGRTDLIQDPEVSKPGFWTAPEAGELVDSLLYPWLLDRTRQQVFEEAQKARIASSGINLTTEVLKNEQLRSRNFFVEADHPEAGRLPYAGPNFRTENGAWRLKSTAPLLGQHNDEVFLGQMGFSRGELVLLRETGAI